LLTIKAPFVASCYAGTDSVALLALKTYLTTISGENRGRLGQFGSFGFMGIIAPTNTATPIGLAAATEKLCFPWMIDSASSKANGVHQIAAAVAALCAGNARPYNPLTDVKVGGLHAQVSAADWHTPGEAGTEELGLDAGLIPLMTAADGSIQISRTVTAYEPVANVQAADYFDLQDWQVLYDYRAQCYAASQSPQFKIAKASDDVAKALNSRFIAIAKAFEDLGMFQHVDLLAGQFTFSRSPANRAAFVYSCPANVVPGFMNKGVDVIGTTQFDLVV
jgi:phage tail sheath gpL-like